MNFWFKKTGYKTACLLELKIILFLNYWGYLMTGKRGLENDPETMDFDHNKKNMQ